MIKRVLPKENTARSGEYSVTANFHGVWENFIFLKAQSGDIKGSLTFRGPGIRVTMGNRIFPINLNYYRIIEQFREYIKGKKRIDLDHKEFDDLVTKALEPYTN